MEQEHEILINALHISSNDQSTPYEFVLDASLAVKDCVKVNSMSEGDVELIEEPKLLLAGMLFELNHVRVNPNIDNTLIIKRFTNALIRSGVNVNNPPSGNDMAICYRPLGTINANVRFHLDHHGRPIFLTPSIKPCFKVINNPKHNDLVT